MYLRPSDLVYVIRFKSEPCNTFTCILSEYTADAWKDQTNSVHILQTGQHSQNGSIESFS